MKKFVVIALIMTLNGYAASRPENSDKYRDSFPSVFQKSHPTYEPPEQYHPNFPPQRPNKGSETFEVLPPERKATQKVPPGKIEGPPVESPPEDQNDQANPKEVPPTEQVSPKESMPTNTESPKETVQNDNTAVRTAKPAPEGYDYQGLSTKPPERAPKQNYPTNNPPPQVRPNQGKRPPPPPRPNPLQLQHKGEVMTHPQPQRNPEGSKAISPFPKFPKFNQSSH